MNLMWSTGRGATHRWRMIVAKLRLKTRVKLMDYAFLLIGEKMETRWPLVLEQAISSLGRLAVTSEQGAALLLNKNLYDIIIIDAGAVSNTVELVSQLRELQPKARVIVATASPTWQRAREVLQAGATDYIRKSQNGQKLLTDIQAVLNHCSSITGGDGAG